MSFSLNHRSILVTGGAGSFGRGFAETVLQRFPAVRRVVVYSRDERKHFEMAQALPADRFPALEFVIGDIRDAGRLRRACEGIDVVVHAAAMKHIHLAELNPIECIRTNVLGAENVINAALDTGVQHVVALSTDKAAAPTSLYGAAKLCADKLFVAAGQQKGNRDIRFSIVRYGNVLGSPGSVVPLFLQKRHEGVLPVTHPEMTRFSITLEAGIELVLYALENALGGEVFVPKLPTFRVGDLATAIGPECEQRIIGLRPGERLHEEMITEPDARTTLELEKYYVILPAVPQHDALRYQTHYQGKPVSPDFRYASETNPARLSVTQLRDLIKQHVNTGFAVS